MSLFFAVVLFLANVWRTPSQQILPPLPVLKHDGAVFMDDYIALTRNYTTPVIVRGYFDVSAFSNVCACNGTDGVFDGLDVVYIPNENAKTLVPMGIYPDSLTAGVDYWEKHVCKKENSYVFYEQIHMLRYPDLHDKMHRWFEKIDNTIKLSPKIKDPQFKKRWYQELFLGYAAKPLQPPSKSGSLMHQGDVQNYYIQICGSKRWIMGRDSLRFNDERDIPYSGQYFGGHEVLQLLNRTDVHVGWTRPGDMLLNPVWLWHLVQTNEGNKFGITYKMGGHFIREFAPKHIRPRYPRDELFMGNLRYWLLFVRARTSQLDWVKQCLLIVVFGGATGLFCACFLVLRRHQKTS